MYSNVDNTLAIDPKNMSGLKLLAKKDQKEALHAVSKQFETVFLNMMLKSMRDATPQDGIFDSEQNKMYTTMLDQQLAQKMSDKGIGLAAIMERQLTQMSSPRPVKPLKAEELKPTLTHVSPVRHSPSKAAPDSHSFIQKLLPHAEAASKETGIPAKFMLGQAALESAWGKKEIKSAGGMQSFNLFGIKAGKNWHGRVVTAMTTEYTNGVPKKVAQNFKAYSSYEEAFKDYGKLISGNPRYAHVVGSRDAQSFASQMQASGYATDPLYGKKLHRILSAEALNTVA